MENLPRENHLDAEKKPKPKLKRSLSSTTRYGFPIIETNKIGEKTTEHAQQLSVAFHSTPKKKNFHNFSIKTRTNFPLLFTKQSFFLKS